jgi:Type II CAAX prenyl endopeptidase Rce1-like
VSNRKRQDASESQSASRSSAGWWLSRDYLEQSRRPLVSLAFIVPLLATYEGGVVYLGPAALRNGADVWLRHLLGQIGLGQYFLLPVLTIGLLLAWHHLTRERWRLPREIVLGMYLESIVLAFGLLGIGYLERNLSQLALAALNASAEDSAELRPEKSQHAVPHSARSASAVLKSAVSKSAVSISKAPSTATPLPKAALAVGAISSPGARLVGFCGAGIYEEALFRLLLLPPLAWLLGMFSIVRPWRVGLAIVLTSLLFSAAHYSGAQGEEFQWFSASFRCLAGVFFATLFVYRGFGIAAGTHALYDVLVGLA